MAKNKDTYIRPKGKDKQKNTFNKYGKYTSKGIRQLDAIKKNTLDKKEAKLNN
jgi:hypothetical protein